MQIDKYTNRINSQEKNKLICAAELFIMIDSLINMPLQELLKYESNPKYSNILTPDVVNKIYKNRILNLGITLYTYEHLTFLNYNNRYIYYILSHFIQLPNECPILLHQFHEEDNTIAYEIADIIKFDIYKYLSEEETKFLFVNRKVNILAHLYRQNKIQSNYTILLYVCEIDDVDFFKYVLAGINTQVDYNKLYLDCMKFGSEKIREYLVHESNVFGI